MCVCVVFFFFLLMQHKKVAHIAGVFKTHAPMSIVKKDQHTYEKCVRVVHIIKIYYKRKVIFVHRKILTYGN